LCTTKHRCVMLPHTWACDLKKSFSFLPSLSFSLLYVVLSPPPYNHHRKMWSHCIIAQATYPTWIAFLFQLLTKEETKDFWSDPPPQLLGLWLLLLLGTTDSHHWFEWWAWAGQPQPVGAT
jgi:hypothetical protein